jgi:hypothetical protein
MLVGLGNAVELERGSIFSLGRGSIVGLDFELG